MSLARGQPDSASSPASSASGGSRLRLLIALMALLCTASCYISRQNLSLAIIAMTTSADSNSGATTTTSNPINASSFGPLVKILESGAEQEPDQTYGPRYDWGGSSSVLGAFFYTYVACQIPGGRLAEVVGPKWILFAAGFGSAVLSCVSPLAASLEATGDWSFYGVRLLMGVFQSAIFPACYTMLTNWLPLNERQIALTLMNASCFVGGIIAMESTGFFVSTKIFGWPWAFYFPGIVCFIWSTIWLVFGTSQPQEHRCITKQELEFIETNKGDVKSCSKTLDWAKVLRSRQVWGVVVAFFSSNWSFSLMLQMLPSYLSYIQGIGTKENARINELMYAIYIVGAPLVGALSSYLIRNGTCGLSRIAVRKLCETIAVWGQAVCFIVLVQLGIERDLVQVVLYVQMFSYAFVNGGEVHLPTEISADFGGTIYAIANCIGSCTGFIIPRVIDWIVVDKGDIQQWNTFLYLAAGVSFVGNLLFILIGGNQPEDLSKVDLDDLGVATFKLIEAKNGGGTNKANQLELNELDKLKTSTKDYSSISMPTNNNNSTRINNNNNNTKRPSYVSRKRDSS